MTTETMPHGHWRHRIAEYPLFHSIGLSDGVITPGPKTPEIDAAASERFVLG